MILEEDSDSFRGSSSQSQKGHAINEILSRPDLMGMIAGAVFIMIGSAIRLIHIPGNSALRAEPYAAKENEASLIQRRTLNEIKAFWAKVPRRFWNFYIDAFIIPLYRNEWGEYKTWSCRDAERPKRSTVRKKRRKKSKSVEECESTLVPHDHSKCERVRINIAGMTYETQLGTLERFPDTLLGNPYKRIQYYDPVAQEYYFDRNRHAFEAILYFYQSGGRFRRPENVSPDILVEDAEYFQLGDAVIDQYRNEEGLTIRADREAIIPKDLLRRKICLLFDFPDSSIQAEITALISMSALFLSIIIFCIESIDLLEAKNVYGLTKDNIIVIKRYPVTRDLKDPFHFTETACTGWFILELGFRFLTCPVCSKFIKNPINIIDFVAIIPYFFNTLSENNYVDDVVEEDEEVNLNTLDEAIDHLYLLRLVRVVRVFRIFKLSRHSKGLKILSKTLKASMNELMLLIFFIILGVILFSSAMYFAEIGDENNTFPSIPNGFWWALITITTVGFGDVVPETILGKIVGAICAVAGVLTIALPVPVIVSNFNYFYHQAIDEQDLHWINMNHVQACPYRPAGFQRKSQRTDKISSEEDFGDLMKCDDNNNKKKK